MYVEKYQRQLHLQGYDPGKPDGDFGPKTCKAAMNALVKAGRKDNRLGKKALANSPPPVKPRLKSASTTKPRKIEIPVTSRSISEIIWHCAATPEGRSIGNNPAATIDRWHKERGWSGIGYHAVVDLDGRIYRGRDWSETGAHAKGHNRGSLGFAYVGGVAKDGRSAKDTRTPEQRASMLWLSEAVTAKYPNIHRLSGHSQYANKACPSFHVPDDEIGNIPGFYKGHKD